MRMIAFAMPRHLAAGFCSGSQAAPCFLETQFHAFCAAFAAAIQLFFAFNFLVSHRVLLVKSSKIYPVFVNIVQFFFKVQTVAASRGRGARRCLRQ